MQTARTFRVFISSTFGDLKSERNALQEKVFPRLRKMAEAAGCRFQAIDLRWGISEEAGLDQQTMKICLGEIERCQKISPRPNFIILLGNRYGWQPLPFEIAGSEFERIFPYVPKENAALVTRWYWRDDNSVPAVYLLQPRIGDSVEYDTGWKPIEGRLHAALELAAVQAGLAEADLVKYQTSATEQEIIHGALQVVHAREHIFCFAREIQDLPHDKRAGDLLDLLNETPDANAAERLSDLKLRLTGVLGDNYHEYQVNWSEGGVSEGYLEHLCNDVYQELARVIQKEISQLQQVEPLEKEILVHEIFGKERVEFFVGRADILDQIDGYLLSTNRRPLVILGTPGSGKSSLIAKSIQNARRLGPGVQVLYRFCGVTPEASSESALLESLCRQIMRSYDRDEEKLPAGYNGLVKAFLDCLTFASPGAPLVIFLDAVDQLGETVKSGGMKWLPAELPPHVKVVISMLTETCQILADRLPQENLLFLKPLEPAQSQTLLDLWLKQAGRTLQPEKRRSLEEHYQACPLVLYLKLAFEEARRWHSYDGLPGDTSAGLKLGRDIPELLDTLFERLSRTSTHGQVLVEKSLGFLAAARNGLSEEELLDLLSRDAEVLADFQRRSPKSPPVDRLPAVVWSRLYLDLEPYLSDRSADGTSLLTFYHPTTFGQAAKRRYLSGEKIILRHHAMAEYFEAQPLEWEGERKRANLRKISEWPFQQVLAQDWSMLQRSLLDYDFLQAACNAGRVRKVIEDFEWAESIRSDLALLLKDWTEWKEFLLSEVHNFERYQNRYPQIFHQQAFNSSREGLVARRAQADTHYQVLGAWFERVNRPERPPRKITRNVLVGHDQPVLRVMTTRDGQQMVSAGRDGTLIAWNPENGDKLWSIQAHQGGIICMLIHEEKEVITGGRDHRLLVWDLKSGIRTAAFEGHSAPITAACLVDAVLAASGDAAGTIYVWEVATGRSLMQFTAEKAEVTSLASPGEERLAAGYEDGRIRIWEIATGSLVSMLSGHRGRVLQLAGVGAGNLLSGSQDGSLRLWDLGKGTCLQTYLGHRASVTGCQLLKQGRFLSWSFDGTLRMWSLESATCLQTLIGHQGAVSSVVVMDPYSLSTSQDGTLRSWDLKSGMNLNTFSDHEGWVNDLTLAGSSLAITASQDKTLRVWNLAGLLEMVPQETLEDPASLKGEIQKVKRCVILDREMALFNILTSRDEDEYHLWNLVSGKHQRVIHEGDRELEKILKKTVSQATGGPFFGSPPVKALLLEVAPMKPSINAVAVKNEENIQGLGCIGMAFAEDGRYREEQSELAFYPLQCRRWAYVYDFDRTVAVDGANRVHVLWLHGATLVDNQPVTGPVEKEVRGKLFSRIFR